MIETDYNPPNKIEIHESIVIEGWEGQRERQRERRQLGWMTNELLRRGLCSGEAWKTPP